MWISRNGEIIITHILTFQYRSSSTKIVVCTTRTSCDNTLVGYHLTIHNLVNKTYIYLIAKTFLGIFLHLTQDFCGILLQLMNGVSIRWVEWQGNHTLLRTEVDTNHSIIISHITRLQFLIILWAIMNLIMVFHLVIGNPNTTQASSLSSHDVNTVTEVDRQLFHTRTSKLQYFVFHKAIIEDSLYQRDGNIVRTNTTTWFAFQPYKHYLWRIDVPSIAKQLFYQFASTFTNTHVSKRTITCVGIRTKNHVSALHHCLTCILVNHGLISRNIDTTIFLGSRQSKYMVVFIDSTTYRTQRVVAVSHSVRKRELFQSTGTCRLDDSHISNVVRHHRIKANAHFLTLTTIHIMCT